MQFIALGTDIKPGIPPLAGRPAAFSFDSARARSGVCDKPCRDIYEPLPRPVASLYVITSEPYIMAMVVYHRRRRLVFGYGCK